MRVSRIPGRRCIPLARFDWRSLNGGHSNPRRDYLGDWSGRRLGATHYHPFAMNYDNSIKTRMRNTDLKGATEIDVDLQTFEAMRATVGKLFKINNIEVVERPPWEYKLPFKSQQDRIR